MTGRLIDMVNKALDIHWIYFLVFLHVLDLEWKELNTWGENLINFNVTNTVISTTETETYAHW